MKGAIFFSGQYGSTKQYAEWISAETGLTVFDIKDRNADPGIYDFLVLGSSVITFILTNHKWVAKHLGDMAGKPVVLFTVSGAGAGEKLSGWVKDSLPSSLVARADHVALRGRMNPRSLPWWKRMILIMGAMGNRDAQARKEELQGFDYMDKSAIDPIVSRIKELQARPFPTANAA